MLPETGWHDPAVPAQQYELASGELADWRRGKPHGPFDALKACAERIAFTHAQPRILDLGAGTGYYSEVLRELWPDCWYVGLDYSEAMVDFARRQYRATPRVSFVQGDARDLLRYDAGAFDLVLHGCCLIHLPIAEWGAALKHAARITAPDGYLLAQKTPIARTRERTERHAAYGTTIIEHFPVWSTFARAYSEAGLTAVWEERWNEHADPALVSVLFQRKDGAR